MPTDNATRCYLVCATHRSGSNLVCQALWHTDVCGRPQEFFSPTRAEHIFREHNLTHDPSRDYRAYLRELTSKRATDNGVFGGKIMWAHLDPFRSAILSGRDHDPRDTATLLREAFGDDLRCIWARREDKLRQAISMWKAKQTNIYNSIQSTNSERPQPAATPKFDFEQIASLRARFEHEDASWRAFFEDNDLPYRAVTYETFVDRYQDETRELVAFLGIDAPADLRVAPTTYTKLADATNEEWHRRFTALETSQDR